MRFAVAALVVAVSVCDTGLAEAKPSLWDAARDPDVAREHALLEDVERLLDEDAVDLLFQPQLPDRMRALELLHAAGGARMKDPRLRVIYAELLDREPVDRPRVAREVLDGVVVDGVPPQLAGTVWFSIAIASAKLADRDREVAAYTEALDVSWLRGLRATIFMNRGESKMMAGNLDDAILDYRRSLEVSRSPKEASLAYWGLAVALDRSGDHPAALEAAEKAFGTFRFALDVEGVFFVPAYEVHYYRALAAMALARREKVPQDGIARYQQASADWTAYVAHATADDPWAPLARRRLERCQAEVARLEKATGGGGRARGGAAGPEPRPP